MNEPGGKVALQATTELKRTRMASALARRLTAGVFAGCMLGAACVTVQAQPVKPVAASARPLAETSSELAQIGPAMSLLIGKSTLLRLQDPIERISIGNPGITDATLISKREIYFLGKALGTTNVIIWSNAGRATVIDVTVDADLTPLENQLKLFLPDEKDISVVSTSGSIVLRGTVADAVK